jgi:Kef-type K+ transport system membrane component KefB
VQWKQGHVKGAVAAAILVVAAAALIAFLRSRGRLGSATGARARGAIAAVVLALAVAAGYGEQRHYLTHRYEHTGQIQDLDEALRWSRDVRDARIGVAGIRGVFTQYPFYGTDLSNRVQWVGVRGPHDSYKRIPNCFEWRRAIDAGGYTHVVTTFDPYLPGSMRNSPEGRWTQSDPNAHVVIRDGPVRVFEIRGPLDPAGCTGQKPLTQAQLHSVPNLNGTPNNSR